MSGRLVVGQLVQCIGKESSHYKGPVKNGTITTVISTLEIPLIVHLANRDLYSNYFVKVFADPGSLFLDCIWAPIDPNKLPKEVTRHKRRSLIWRIFEAMR
jgi:hypothetical protein